MRTVILAEEASETIKHLIKTYESTDYTPLDCAGICSELGELFNACHEQDPTEFLFALAQNYTSLSSILNHRIAIETSCSTCSSISALEKEKIIIDIPTTGVTTNVKMNDLLSNFHEWYVDNNKLCATCNTPLQVQSKLLDAHSVIVCKLDVWNCEVGGNKVRRTVKYQFSSS